MGYEKPQKGNPHKLTCRQHVFPKACIDRFSNDDGCVSLFHKQSKSQRPAKSSDAIFCAMRVWDQRAENGYMKNIEDQFQVLVDAIMEDKILKIGSDEKHVVNAFVSLWHMRSTFKIDPVSDWAAQGVAGGNWTKDEEERFERSHVGYNRAGGIIPGRQIAGLKIQMGIDSMSDTLSDAQWGIIRADQSEFVVPDCCPNSMVIPLTPTLCLANQGKNGVVLRENVAEINRYAVAVSCEYYFARDLSECPL